MPRPSRSRRSSGNARSFKHRVNKACDHCRLKKAKCDMSTPCKLCVNSGQLCLFTERKNVGEKCCSTGGLVELLQFQQAQLIKAVQLLYKQSSFNNTNDETPPPIHEILDQLGVLDDSMSPRQDFTLFGTDLDLPSSPSSKAVPGVKDSRASSNGSLDPTGMDTASWSADQSLVSFPRPGITGSLNGAHSSMAPYPLLGDSMAPPDTATCNPPFDMAGSPWNPADIGWMSMPAPSMTDTMAAVEYLRRLNHGGAAMSAAG